MSVWKDDQGSNGGNIVPCDLCYFTLIAAMSNSLVQQLGLLTELGKKVILSKDDKYKEVPQYNKLKNEIHVKLAILTLIHCEIARKSF